MFRFDSINKIAVASPDENTIMVLRVQVHQFTYRVGMTPDLKPIFFDSKGRMKEGTRQHNQCLVKLWSQLGMLRKVSHANGKYCVLPDNRIISLNPSSAGKEVFTGIQHNNLRTKLIGDAE